MELFLVFASLVATIYASTEEELWEKFKQNHSKIYENFEEDNFRFDIFKTNLKMIKKHNSKYENGDESWMMSVNQFADLTDKEFEIQYLTAKPSGSLSSSKNFKLALNACVPDSIDWREMGAVSPVKNQESCGCCWAVSAIGSLEGQNAIKHNKLMELSIQELIDCSTDYGNYGCRGGIMTLGFQYIKDHGISKQSDYSFTAKDESCKPHSNSSGIRVISYTNVLPSEDYLKEAVGTVGPVSIGINALNIRFYEGGIFDDPSCRNTLNHGVLAVGYGSEGYHDYWIVKNSWGNTWGENGYIRMSRNKNNQCGISSLPSFPNIL